MGVIIIKYVNHSPNLHNGSFACLCVAFCLGLCFCFVLLDEPISECDQMSKTVISSPDLAGLRKEVGSAEYARHVQSESEAGSMAAVVSPEISPDFRGEKSSAKSIDEISSKKVPAAENKDAKETEACSKADKKELVLSLGDTLERLSSKLSKLGVCHVMISIIYLHSHVIKMMKLFDRLQICSRAIFKNKTVYPNCVNWLLHH